MEELEEKSQNLGAIVEFFEPPAVPGFGTSGGFSLRMLDKTNETDYQVFEKVNASVPSDIPLTSFSIMLARHKGDFANYVKGTPYLSNLKEGDKVLILESCTHHVSCDDIGRIKIPGWLNKFTGSNLKYEVVAGLDDLPENIHNYAMVIQCGGCMITRKQIANRLKPAIDAGIPVSNYGMAIAWVHGIYQRTIAPFIKEEMENTSV